MATSVFGIPTGNIFGSRPILNTASIFRTNNARPANVFASTNSQQTSSSISAYIGYIASIFLIIMIILVFVHYFIAPVFQLNPGGPGIIPVPGLRDSKVYWRKQPAYPISDISGTNLGSQATNWSFSLDFFIEEPLNINSKYRILFNRGGTIPQSATESTLKGQIKDYNICIALMPDTNDMIVSTINVDGNMENITIPNVPVQKPFRVGVILMDMIMEVYVNGMLFKTRKLDAPPKQIGGEFVPPQGSNTSVGKVMNLQIWKRPITASEMRYAKPALETGGDYMKIFDATGMKVTGGLCTNDAATNE